MVVVAAASVAAVGRVAIVVVVNIVLVMELALVPVLVLVAAVVVAGVVEGIRSSSYYTTITAALHSFSEDTTNPEEGGAPKMPSLNPQDPRP